MKNSRAVARLPIHQQKYHSPIQIGAPESQVALLRCSLAFARIYGDLYFRLKIVRAHIAAVCCNISAASLYCKSISSNGRVCQRPIFSVSTRGNVRASFRVGLVARFIEDSTSARQFAVERMLIARPAFPCSTFAEPVYVPLQTGLTAPGSYTLELILILPRCRITVPGCGLHAARQRNGLARIS